jgi:hypothetical protein
MVEKGYSQVEGVDYEDNFSLVDKVGSIRLFLVLAIAYDLEVEKMDTKTTFLHNELKEEIFMKQLDQFLVERREDMVCEMCLCLCNQKANTH